ncbi:MAG: lipopolysaccharide biosynthesis protein, partial [Candidatus Zixiibacteriota bacterium]
MLKQSSVYMAGQLLSRLISFIMLPIYTRFLTPADYGILELLSMTVDIVAMLAGAGISAALLRFYSEKET